MPGGRARGTRPAAQRCCRLIYGNLSEWGPQAERYEEQLRKDRSVHGMAFVEMHAKPARLNNIVARLGTLGWTANGSPASQSRRSAAGSHGGTLIATRSYWAAGHTPPGALPQGSTRRPAPPGV